MPRIFVLGDSRTGTRTLHRFFQQLGLPSIHHYIEESGQSLPDHEHHQENWSKLREFLSKAPFTAYADYPTRSFFVELCDEYPDAYFILTTRKDLDTWRRSMESFFSKFRITLDLPHLEQVHLEVNEAIRHIYRKAGRGFLEICIDDDAATNSDKIKRFLNLQSDALLGRENASVEYKVNILSGRATLYAPTGSNVLEYVRSVCAPCKALLSEYGWTYLANDTNRFMEYQFGDASWDEHTTLRAVDVLKARERILASRNITYIKFVVPEKSVIYPEFLPRALAGTVESTSRPALKLASENLAFFHYLADFIKDAKSYGQLYFRGDSHANWLGAFLIYARVVEILNALLEGKESRAPIRLDQLTPEIAAYDGDLLPQLPQDQKTVLDKTWPWTRASGGLEYCVRLILSDAMRKAQPASCPTYIPLEASSRPLLAYESSNRGLPRAVIFRDSTVDLMLDLLAEHFSRSVFVWHHGLVLEDVIEKEQPDVVLHFMAERFLVHYENAPVLAKVGPK